MTKRRRRAAAQFSRVDAAVHSDVRGLPARLGGASSQIDLRGDRGDDGASAAAGAAAGGAASTTGATAGHTASAGTVTCRGLPSDTFASAAHRHVVQLGGL